MALGTIEEQVHLPHHHFPREWHEIPPVPLGHGVARSLLSCSWSHCNVFVYLGLESDLYMKEQRNAVCLWIGVIMTLHALCGRYCQQITHVPTVSQGCLAYCGGVRRISSDLVWTPGASLGPRTTKAPSFCRKCVRSNNALWWMLILK